MCPTLSQLLASQREADQRSDSLRTPPKLVRGAGIRYEISGKGQVVSFCSNDYLGIASEPPRSLAGAQTSAPRSTSASRLVSGDLPELRDTEASFASYVGHEDAIFFPSGYQANLAALSALSQLPLQIYSDALNHASIIDGLKLGRSQAKPTIVPHLQRPTATHSQTALWVMESIFSMDGDGPSREDLQLWRDAGNLVYLDAAHSIGLSEAPPTAAADILCAPMGKAFAAAGGFIAGTKDLCDYLRGHARGFIYSTGPYPPLALELTRTIAWMQSDEASARRAKLTANILRFRSHFEEQPTTAIQPIALGTNERALRVATALLEAGFHAQAIRPPTVPTGTARLRITLSAAHTTQEIDRFAALLHQLLATP